MSSGGFTLSNFPERYIPPTSAGRALSHSKTGGFTPSDFPEMDLDQDELDDLLEALSGTIEE